MANLKTTDDVVRVIFITVYQELKLFNYNGDDTPIRKEIKNYINSLLDELEKEIPKKEMPTSKDMSITDIHKARETFINGGWNCCRLFIQQKLAKMRGMVETTDNVIKKMICENEGTEKLPSGL